MDNKEKKISKKVEMVLENLEKNHNHSLALEILKRNKKNMDRDAIIYRQNHISYQKMFIETFKMVKSLKQMGYKKGDEIILCMKTTPEFYYIFLAASILGLKFNSVPEWIDLDYFKMIIENAKTKTIFITDIYYETLKDVIENSSLSNIVSFSLSDSLPLKDGKKVNPFKNLDSSFMDFSSRNEDIKKISNKNVLDNYSFISIGTEYKGKNKDLVEDVSLDDDFTITYSSGTTALPKAILHPVRSYMTISRFKDKDVSGMPEMKNMVVMAHIPTYTHVALTAQISDVFFERCTVAPEPIYQKEAFPYTLLINKPNYVNAGPGFWMYLCKKLKDDEMWKNITFEQLFLPCATGEGLKPGQEKYINQVFKEHKFGTDKMVIPTKISIGGGTSEQSGIFVTLFKSLLEKLYAPINKKKPLGLTPAKMAKVDVVRENGESCEIGEIGQIVISSNCTMKGYYYQKDLNNDFFFTKEDGTIWSKVGAYGIKSDIFGRIYMKGRYKDDYICENGCHIPLFVIEDLVEKDTKNIIASYVVRCEDELVIHIELNENSINKQEKVMDSIYGRLTSLPKEVLNKINIRILAKDESFPLFPSGKTNTVALEELGFKNSYKRNTTNKTFSLQKN